MLKVRALFKYLHVLDTEGIFQLIKIHNEGSINCIILMLSANF